MRGGKNPTEIKKKKKPTSIYIEKEKQTKLRGSSVNTFLWFLTLDTSFCTHLSRGGVGRGSGRCYHCSLIACHVMSAENIACVLPKEFSRKEGLTVINAETLKVSSHPVQLISHITMTSQRLSPTPLKGSNNRSCYLLTAYKLYCLSSFWSCVSQG